MAVAIGFALLGLSGARAVAQSSSGSEAVESFASVASVSADGSLEVTEQITWNFGSAFDRHGIFRYIPEEVQWTNALPQGLDSSEKYVRVTPVQWMSVNSPTGAPSSYDISSEGGPNHQQLTVAKIGSASINVNGIHTYEIKYRLERAVVDNMLSYSLNGQGWVVPVKKVTARIAAPIVDEAAVRCLRNGGPTTADECRVTVANGVVNVETSGSGIEVLVPLQPSDSYAPLKLEVIHSLGRGFDFSGSRGPLALISTLGAAGVAALVGRRGRDRVFASGSALGDMGAPERPLRLGEKLASPVEFEPPEGIRPGLIDPARSGDVSQTSISAMLVDLAVRGHITIETFDEDGEEFKLTHNVPPVRQSRTELTQNEINLVQTLFQGYQQTTSTHLRDREELAGQMAMIKRALITESVQRGWWADDPKSTRAKWVGLGMFSMLIGVVATIGLAITSRYGLVGLSFVVLGVGLLIAAKSMPVQTATGSRIAARLKGFELLFDAGEGERIALAEKVRTQGDLFSEYLPYAMAFGNVDKWVRTFGVLGLPMGAAGSQPWIVGPGYGGYGYGHGGVFNDRSFSNAIQGFDNSLNNSIAAGAAAAAAAASSSSSGSGGSSFGGGGSSSGGGGGGSW